jgi:pilus assembly protein Flp/PilA
MHNLWGIVPVRIAVEAGEAEDGRKTGSRQSEFQVACTMSIRPHKQSVGVMNANRWLRVLREDDGQDLVEYALIIALIMLGAVASLNSLVAKITGVFTYIGTVLSSVV